MTPLKQKVIRRTESTIRDRGRSRPLVIILYPNSTIGLRPLKTRQEEVISIDSVWSLAVSNSVSRKRCRKRQQRRRCGVASSDVSPSEVERLYLMGHSIPDICNMLNASVDVVEDAIRDRLRDWRFRVHQYERAEKYAKNNKH